MICRKCGHDAPENSAFCPACGRSFSGGKTVKKIIITVIIVLLSILFAAVIFMFGHYFGKTEAGKQMNTPDIVASISERIREIAYFPVDIELNESDINTIIQKYSYKMTPLKNVALTFPREGGITLNGSVDRNDISTLFGTSVPDIIILLLPNDVPLSLHCDPVFKDGQLEANIDSVSIAGLTLDKDALTFIGADTLLSDIISSVLKSEYGEKIEICDIAVKTSDKGEKVLRISARYYLTK